MCLLMASGLRGWKFGGMKSRAVACEAQFAFRILPLRLGPCVTHHMKRSYFTGEAGELYSTQDGKGGRNYAFRSVR